MNYAEYILFRNKNRARRELWAETGQIIVMSVWFGMAFYYQEFEEFFIVEDYMALLLLMNFQKIALFFVKVLFFVPAYLIYKL